MRLRHSSALALFAILSILAHAQSAVHCGTERWDVKDLNDPDAGKVKKKAVNTTVAKLIGMPAIKAGKSDPRYPEEQRLFRVKCKIARFKLEGDSDIHLVIEDPDDPSMHMIAEIPDPRCPDAIAGGHADEFKAARNELEALVSPHKPGKRMQAISPPLEVYLTGVCFFDPPHGQTGRAPNNMELHPVIRVEK